MKSDNQYYGQYFEEAVFSILQNLPIINKTNCTFSPEEIEEMNSAAKEVANSLGHVDNVIYTGRKTSKASGDLICDEKIIELKYVSTGTGTYFNTSISFIDETGFEPFHSRLISSGYLDQLAKTFSGLISTTSLSPVSSSEKRKLIRSSPKWDYFENFEGIIRKEYIKDFFAFLQENPDKLFLFIEGLLTKKIASKEIPNLIIVYNRTKKTFIKISREEISSLISNQEIKNTGLSFSAPGYRFSFGWQNGNGLCNPTIRVFLT